MYVVWYGTFLGIGLVLFNFLLYLQYCMVIYMMMHSSLHNGLSDYVGTLLCGMLYVVWECLVFLLSFPRFGFVCRSLKDVGQLQSWLKWATVTVTLCEYLHAFLRTSRP
jgi:hypothetical protein